MSRPQNYKELYNFRHAQLRNVIKRTFGVLKKRFKVLLLPQAYPLETQVRLVSALAVVHNFILIHDPSDSEFIDDDDNQIQGEIRERGERAVLQEERTRAAEQREQLAQAMWRSYIRN